MQQGRLASSVCAQDGYAGIHTTETLTVKHHFQILQNALDTKAQILVQVILLLPRVRERNIVERDDGRRELTHILKVEAE